MKSLVNGFRQLKVTQGRRAYQLALASMSSNARKLIYWIEHHGVDVDELVFVLAWPHRTPGSATLDDAARRIGERALTEAIKDAADTLRAWGIKYP